MQALCRTHVGFGSRLLWSAFCGWYLVILIWFMKVLSTYISHSLKRRFLSCQTLWPKAVVSDSGRSDGARGRRPQLRLLSSLSSFFPTQCQKPHHACSSSRNMLRKKCLNPPLLGRGVLKDGTETGSLLNPAHLHLVLSFHRRSGSLKL